MFSKRVSEKLDAARSVAPGNRDEVDAFLGLERTCEVTHACPPKGSEVMPCCDRTPFEVPLTDRMTLEPNLVTCTG